MLSAKRRHIRPSAEGTSIRYFYGELSDAMVEEIARLTLGRVVPACGLLDVLHSDHVKCLKYA